MPPRQVAIGRFRLDLTGCPLYSQSIPPERSVCDRTSAQVRFLFMADTRLQCDGCGRPASTAHIAKRLQRLEWSTRFRPLHIQVVLLAAVSPSNDLEFLYAPSGEFAGEAQKLLDVAGIDPSGKNRAQVLTEFQRGGFFLTHVLECPVESPDSLDLASLLDRQFSVAARRIRRSLRPKAIAPISSLLGPAFLRLGVVDLGCSIVLDAQSVFSLDGVADSGAASSLRRALNAASAGMR